MGGEPEASPDRTVGSEAVPEAGWIAPELREELPGLALRYLVIERGSGRSPKHVKERLVQLADRFSGAQAINLRHQPIPWAYRVFYRHIGLDPDEQPTPVEGLALERMKRGGFPSHNLLDDAITIATIESGVALRAFDADLAEGRVGIRPTEPDEPLAGRPGDLPAGTLVIADEAKALGLLFGATAAEHGVNPGTRRMILAAVQVAGVPDIAVEEALWLAAGVIRS
jgi:DNA/RNA-binding domain of Phe-tRNA-synthetase-like protein